MDRTPGLLKEAYARIRRDWHQYWYVFLFAALILLLIHHTFGALCPMRITLGIPCPGCGLTRACLLWLKGDAAAACQMHPLALPAMLLIATYPLMRYLFPSLQKPWSIAVLVWGGLLLILYVYRMATLFPGTEPMCYYESPFREWLESLLRQ